MDPVFPGADPAKRAGFRCACLFSIPVEGTVVGAIELFCRERRKPNSKLMELFSALAGQLGQFVQRRRLEDQLIETQKLETVGKLAGGIAHEFNSIMTAIIGQSERLLAGLVAGDSLRLSAGEIRSEADRAAALTRQLLAYGRQQILQPEALDLNRLIARMEPMLRHLLGEHVEMCLVPFAGLAPVKADAGQIELVLANLAINGRDAMPDGGKLIVQTGAFTVASDETCRFPELKPGDYVTLTISDTGVGLSAESCAHVFEPFFSAKSIGHGADMGLATCYGIIKQSGGHISVDSDLGRGTSFTVYLPRWPEETTSRPRLHAAPKSLCGSETILLVEADPALREMAASMLTRSGYHVLVAADSDEAVALAERQDAPCIDLVFADLADSQAKAHELSDRIIALRPGTKILLTGRCSENAWAHQAEEHSRVRFLPSPFSPSALSREIRATLGTI